VTVDKAVEVVLARLSGRQVNDLAAACESLPTPDGRLAAVIAGAPPGAGDSITALLAAWRSQPALTGSGIALALRLGLATRRHVEAGGTRPVWTGPGTVGEQRLTAGVLHELLADAHERILLISYAAFTLSEVAADLEAAVKRGCHVDVVFETSDDSAGAYTGPQRPFGHVSGINRWRWPTEHRDPGAVLHAKLLVIDGRRALVGSANLTARALQHNLEVGLLTNDGALAKQLEAHVRHLMSSGILRVDS
jgi:phosphatidylserine/phosphatidylglycerophosphate/cardiolipin synthase-like enzyme